jgi:hypothetical protein
VSQLCVPEKYLCDNEGPDGEGVCDCPYQHENGQCEDEYDDFCNNRTRVQVPSRKVAKPARLSSVQLRHSKLQRLAKKNKRH